MLTTKIAVAFLNIGQLKLSNKMWCNNGCTTITQLIVHSWKCDPLLLLHAGCVINIILIIHWSWIFTGPGYPLVQVMVPSNLKYSGGEITPAMVAFWAEKQWHSQPKEVKGGKREKGKEEVKIQFAGQILLRWSSWEADHKTQRGSSKMDRGKKNWGLCQV